MSGSDLPGAPRAAPPTTDPAPAYDLAIHSNPDARAWARFFMETYNRMQFAAPDEEMMLGWFANAMMAAHDHARRALSASAPALPSERAPAESPEVLTFGVQGQDTPEVRELVAAAASMLRCPRCGGDPDDCRKSPATCYVRANKRAAPASPPDPEIGALLNVLTATARECGMGAARRGQAEDVSERRQAAARSSVERAWSDLAAGARALGERATAAEAQVEALRAERLDALEKAAHRERQLSEAWRNLAAAEARAEAATKGAEGLRAALAFAASVIKSGEPWTETCERVIGAALAPGGAAAGGTDEGGGA